MSTPSYLRYANQGATRNLPLDPRLVSSLAFLGDMGITAEVYSGGQPAKGSGGKRVGSTRHDHGNAADVRFFRGDQQLDWARDSDRPFFEDIVRRGREAGITGFGAGPGYMAPGTMHIGFGAPGVWGAGGRAANAPDWLRNAYGGASAGPSAMALGPEPSPSGASSAIQSVMADRSVPSPSPASSGGSMAAPTINIGPKKSSKIQEAMLARALGSGENIRHPLELVGNLAQVWAANKGIKANEASEASALQQAMAGANLDPAYMMAAQLGGDRESLAGAIMSQQSDRAQAAERQQARDWQQSQHEYQVGQDALANARADETLEIQRQKANEPAAAPNSVREYQYARSQGFEGSFADWEQQNRRAGATTINTGTDEGEFAKRAAARMVDRFGTIADTQSAAANTAQTIPVMRELLAQAPQGPIAGRLAEAYPGFSTAGDAFMATVNQIAPTLRIPGSGAQSDKDMDILLGSFPRLRNDPTANGLIMDAFEKKANLNLQRSDIASQALRGEITPAEADRQLSELDRMPLFDDAMRRRLTGEQAPADTTPRDGSGVPVGGSDQGTTVQRARNPQTGEVLELRNGQWVPAQ